MNMADPEYKSTDVMFVYSCSVCGALVYVSNTDTHTQWHEDEPKRMLDAVAKRNFERNAQAYEDFGARMGHHGGHYG